MRFSRSNSFYGEPVQDVNQWASVIMENVRPGEADVDRPAVFQWYSPHDSTWWWVEVTVDDARQIVGDPMDISEDPGGELAEDDPVNTFGLDDNCYYCTVAALLDTTVDALITRTELMQYRDNTFDEVLELLRAAGLSSQHSQAGSFDELTEQMRDAASGGERRFAVGFERSDGSRHMVVGSQDHTGAVFTDFQGGGSSGFDAVTDVESGVAFYLFAQ